MRKILFKKRLHMCVGKKLFAMWIKLLNVMIRFSCKYVWTCEVFIHVFVTINLSGWFVFFEAWKVNIIKNGQEAMCPAISFMVNTKITHMRDDIQHKVLIEGEYLNMPHPVNSGRQNQCLTGTFSTFHAAAMTLVAHKKGPFSSWQTVRQYDVTQL